MQPVFQFLTLYVVVQVLGFIGLPITRRAFSRLSDQGYSFGKSLAILVVGSLLWAGNAYGVFRGGMGGFWVVLPAFAAVAIAVDRRSAGTIAWLRENHRVVLWTEALFLAAFASWAILRSFDPALAHTEQPMDLMLISAIDSSHGFPPQDAWLSGHAIRYYYLGHWLVAMLARLSRLDPATAYNLVQACWYALLVVGAYGVGFNASALGVRRPRRPPSARPGSSTSQRGAVACGLLAAMSVAVVGNLHVVLEVAHARLPVAGLVGWFDVSKFPPPEGDADGLWWWRSSRVVLDRDAAGDPVEIITEFPAFSYLLGDNHAHVLAMPFALVVLGMALNALAIPSPSRWSPRALVPWLLPALACGALVGLNAWDAPTFAAVWVAATALAATSISARRGGLHLAFAAAFAIAVALAIFWPMMAALPAPEGGIALNRSNPTRLRQLLLMFGAFVPGVALSIGAAWRRVRPSATSIGAASAVAVVVLLGSATFRSDGGWTRGLAADAVLLTGAAAVILLLWPRPASVALPPGQRFALLLCLAGLTALLLPQYLYLRDAHGDRMNTVFKFYYQAWPLLAIASTLGIAEGVRLRIVGFSRPGRWLTLAGLGLLGLAMAYPVHAVRMILHRGAEGPRTFDGLADLRAWNPDEWKAIEWIRTHVPRDAVVVEAPGTSYRPETSRVSTATGRPTLLGWASHESQWRGSDFDTTYARRLEALDAIYRPSDDGTLLATLERWDVDYVYLGPAERARYPTTADAERRFERLLQPVFESGPVRLFARRDDARR